MNEMYHPYPVKTYLDQAASFLTSRKETHLVHRVKIRNIHSPWIFFTVLELFLPITWLSRLPITNSVFSCETFFPSHIGWETDQGLLVGQRQTRATSRNTAHHCTTRIQFSTKNVYSKYWMHSIFWAWHRLQKVPVIDPSNPTHSPGMTISGFYYKLHSPLGWRESSPPNTMHQGLKLGFRTKTVIYQRLRNKKTTPSSPLLLFYWTGSGAMHFTPLVLPEVRGWGLGVKEAVWNQIHTNGSININLLKSEGCVFLYVCVQLEVGYLTTRA